MYKEGFSAEQIWSVELLDSAICEVCGQEEETADHVIMGCPFAEDFWGSIGFQLTANYTGAASQLPWHSQEFYMLHPIEFREIRNSRAGFRTDMSRLG
jgi:hypothetical protein